MSESFILPSEYEFSQKNISIHKLIVPFFGTMKVFLNFPDGSSLTESDAEKILEIIKNHPTNFNIELYNNNCNQSVEDIFFNALDGSISHKVLWLSGNFSPTNLKKAMMYTHIDTIIFNIHGFNTDHMDAIISSIPNSKLTHISFHKCILYEKIYSLIDALYLNKTLIHIGLSDMDEYGVRKAYGGEELTEEAEIINGIIACNRHEIVQQMQAS